MRNVTKKLVRLTMVFAMLISYFAPIINVYAVDTNKLSVSFRNGENEEGIVQYSLNDGATWNDVTGNINNESISVTGDNLRIRIVPNQNKEIDYTAIGLEQDGESVLNIPSLGLGSSNGYSVPSNVQSVFLKDVEFGDKTGPSNDNGNNTSNYQGNGTSTLNYTIDGVIEYTSGGGFDHGISFRINDIPYKADESKMVYTEDTAYERDGNGHLIIGDNNQPIPILDPDTMEPMKEKTKLTITGDTIHYDYNQNTNKVSFTFAMAPGTLMTGLVINNQEITGLPSTSDELMAHYTDHRIEIVVDDIDYADTYNIAITAKYPEESEEFMGNFLWDYNPEGYTGPDDKILNGTLVFVKAEYDNHVYTDSDDVNALGGVYIWRDAPRQKTYTDEREGCGEAQFPKGTILTVKIIPDAGYQLVSFGINGGAFEPQEEIGTYKFEVEGGPFHLQADIQKVEDVVKSNTNKISTGAITLGNEESMAVGTARLDVSDNNNLTTKQINGFENAADEYEIQNVFDVSLFNTVYKGSRDASWDTLVDELDNSATITLGMADNYNGKDIIVIHEKHDGTYEILDVEYDKDNNAISFETDSFSNYAIATKGEDEMVTVIHTVDFDSNGGSEVKSKDIEFGKILERPEAPTKEGFTFGGWYIDPELNYSYDFDGPVEGDFTLYARWIDNDDLKEYTVSDEEGNNISFTDEVGHNYKLSIFDILKLTKEEILAMSPDISEEEYDGMMDLLNELASQNGKLLGLYEINVYEENSVTGDNTELHEGPFVIKIKITDDMKDYDTFKLVYVKDDFTLGEVVNLTKEGDYLVGTLPHLSTYMLTGSNSSVNPTTNDNVMYYVTILLISLMSLFVSGLYIKKHRINY